MRLAAGSADETIKLWDVAFAPNSDRLKARAAPNDALRIGELTLGDLPITKGLPNFPGLGIPSPFQGEGGRVCEAG